MIADITGGGKVCQMGRVIVLRGQATLPQENAFQLACEGGLGNNVLFAACAPGYCVMLAQLLPVSLPVPWRECQKIAASGSSYVAGIDREPCNSSRRFLSLISDLNQQR
jgi:hypothetical protein